MLTLGGLHVPRQKRRQLRLFQPDRQHRPTILDEPSRAIPNHFSPAGMDMFALPNEQVERRAFYSLIGVGGEEVELLRKIARQWLDSGEGNIARLETVVRLPAAFSPQ